MYTELILAAVLLIALVVVIFVTRPSRKLSKSDCDKARLAILKTEKLDPAHAILEAHKIFVFTLASLVSEKQRRKIKAAEVIKKFADRFPNTNHVWKSHRLRNRIAHEPEINITKTHAELARRDFIRALKSVSK